MTGYYMIHGCSARLPDLWQGTRDPLGITTEATRENRDDWREKMRLDELVPPIELCKKIPEGEFLDAAHAWVLSDMVGFVCRTSGCEQISGQEWSLIRSNSSRIIRARKRGEEIYPAPMLEEVMVAIGSDGKTGHCIDVYNIQGEWSGYCDQITTDEYNPLFAKEKSGSTTALKLWLKLKGVEDESLD